MKRLFVALMTALGLGVGLSITVSSHALAGTGIQFQPPQGGAPGGTRGGASRGDSLCLRDQSEHNQAIHALAPNTSHYGLTLAERPQFFAYIPQTTAQKVLFVLKDDRGHTLHEQTISIVGKGRVIPLPIANQFPVLEVGKTYEWGIAVLCTGTLQIDSPFTSAWVQRILPPAAVSPYIGQPPSLQQAAALGNHGIWYDMLSTLVQLQHQQRTATIASTWQHLLQSVGLGEVSTMPLD